MPANKIELDHIILRNLLTNDEYMRKIIPFIQRDYFEGIYGELFSRIAKFVVGYNKLPSQEALLLDLQDNVRSEDSLALMLEVMPDLFTAKEENETWLYKETEKWCKDRALYNGIMDSIKIYDGSHATLSPDAIPELLQKALGVSFDTSVGHDYIFDVERRYAYYHESEPRIPFDLEMFNKITKNGVCDKTLNVLMAGPGVGKSLVLCHMAASYLTLGKNVLYITMEMAEEKIAERIDANLLNVTMDQLEELPLLLFKKKVAAISEKTNGNLIIKEYPTGHAHVNHFRALLNELNLKKQFVPDVVIIDYLNICASSRIKNMGGSINSYTYVKTIAEEVRGLGVEYGVPVWTATQVNRTGYQSSDPGMEDTSESFGLPATADFMLAIVSSEELEEAKQLMFIQLKNRYNDPNYYKRFTVGVDRSKMKLYDIAQSTAPTGSGSGGDDKPVFDNSDAGSRIGMELPSMNNIVIN